MNDKYFILVVIKKRSLFIWIKFVNESDCLWILRWLLQNSSFQFFLSIFPAYGLPWTLLNFVVNLVGISCLTEIYNWIRKLPCHKCPILISSLKVLHTYCRASKTLFSPKFLLLRKTIQYWFHSRAQPKLVLRLCECLVFNNKVLGVMIHYRSAKCIKNLLPIVFMMIILLLQKCSTFPPNL